MAQKKSENSTYQLHVMRHSMAHIMAAALQQLYPKAKFGVGPVIDNGFYYDVDIDKTLSPDDLKAVTKKMQEIIKQKMVFERQEVGLNEAISLFKQAEQPFKVELLSDLKKHGTTVAKDIDREQLGAESAEKVTTVSLYKTGDFVDLCRGPHLEDTGQAGVFKLTKVSGAYWRGDEKNPQLQRIYGVAFATKEDLNNYLEQLAEAEKRDHRKLGKQLDLFTFSNLVGSGLPLWTPRGTAMRNELKRALADASHDFDVQEVTIPHIAKLDLYKTSGHADKFKDELLHVKGKYQDFILKPVNCPHHTQLYASTPKSYRDLPVRYMESTMQYRDEKPGEIGGLTRVRAITVDDGHTFCTVDQIKDEAKLIAEIIKRFYTDLGMYGDHWVSLSVRDPQDMESYIGEDADWNRAEELLQQVSDDLKLNAQRMEGEAALYGPKLDFMFKDALGNERQLSTIQIDFAMPKRFGLTYVDSDGQEKTPIMVHRAILGSYERFMAILIEHFAGNFPTWLAPEQVRLITVNDSEKIVDKAQQWKQQLKQAGIRAELDLSSESVGKKIRSASLMKVPYTVVVGEKEVESDQLNPRLRADLGDREVSLSFNDFVTKLQAEINSRSAESTL
ncbi:threonine--tRNA ligase [Patescibacteria group bacterium]|nr:MAG: threonine--tRNA ligase [Patescibacteria group bacterium]